MCNEPNYYSHQADHPIGYGGQYNLKVGKRPSGGDTHMIKEHINEMTSKMDVLKEFTDGLRTSHDLVIQSLHEISSRLSQRAEGQTLNPNLDSQSQEENTQMVAIRSPVPPTPLEENEVGKEYKNEKEVGEMTLKFNIQINIPIENLKLVEEKESTQGDETQKVVNVEDGNIIQPKAMILECNGLPSSEREGRSTTQSAIMIHMIVGEKLDIVRPQLHVVKFIKPQPKTKISQPSTLGGHEGSAKVMAKSHPGRTSRPSTSTHHQQNGKMRVENKKGSKLGVKHGWPPPWSP
ncbi:hypothetical protein Pyn_17631 [Prunus yedoensis var. nudiflora]|uniref:Uncharacterized protein n=1 Tax=Prunus yedoensis var. nudiflora TaxID=2094558 RepID=A0A314UBZ2_PRUYE|nr:hypothetical protein Pyn_17631 [Prunus yedoensis var. nudiflora]